MKFLECRTRTLSIHAALLATLFLPACDGCVSDDFRGQGTFEPAVLDLGPVAEGNQCDGSLLLQNVGTAPLEIDAVQLIEQSGDWTLGERPAELGVDTSSETTVTYTAGGELNVRQSVTIQVDTNGVGNDGVVTGIVTAIPVASTAGIAAVHCNNDDAWARCDGPVEFGSVNIGDPNAPIDQRTGSAIDIKIVNEGSEEFTITSVALETAVDVFTVQGVERENVVVDLPITLAPSRIEECQPPEPGIESEVTVSLFFSPTAIGAIGGKLRVATDALEGGDITVDLNGFGSDIGILIDPPAIAFPDAEEGTVYETEIRVANVGTNDAGVNNTCLDIDGDETCDAFCTGAEDDVALEGLLQCRVERSDGSAEGKGFILSGTDAMEGGDDERTVILTFSPSAGNAVIPDDVFLRFETNILNNNVWTSRIVGGALGQLSASGNGPECGPNLCVQAMGDIAEASSWTGSVALTLTNVGDASVDITGFEWDGPDTVADDYDLSYDGATVDFDAPEISLGVGEAATLTLDYANNDASGADFINLLVKNTGLNAELLLPIAIAQPTE